MSNVLIQSEMKGKEFVLVRIVNPRWEFIMLHVGSHHLRPLWAEHIDEARLVFNLINVEVYLSKLWPLSTELPCNHDWFVLNWFMAETRVVKMLSVHNERQLRLTHVLQWFLKLPLNLSLVLDVVDNTFIIGYCCTLCRDTWSIHNFYVAKVIIFIISVYAKVYLISKNVFFIQTEQLICLFKLFYRFFMTFLRLKEMIIVTIITFV